MSDLHPEFDDSGPANVVGGVIVIVVFVAAVLLAIHHHDSKTADNPTARCVDGTYSHSQTHQGTCSHHGGVAQWLDDGTDSQDNEPADVEAPDVCYDRGGAYYC